MRVMFIYILLFLQISVCDATEKNKAIEKQVDYLHFAAVEDSIFYMSLQPYEFGKAHVVRKSNLLQKTTPIRHAVGGPRNEIFSFNWFLCGDNLFSYSVFITQHIGRRVGLSVNIVYREFETRDSVVVSQTPPQRIIEKMIFVSPVSEYFRAIAILHRGNHEEIEKTVDKFYEYLNFDIFFNPSDSLINFYMRDKDAFYIWEAPLPKPLPKGYTSSTDWQLKQAYAAPHYDPKFIPRTQNPLYDNSKTRHHAITDTLFFDGHFKVLHQDGEKYIINRQHGIIYHLGDSSIVRIGTVLADEHYPKIQGKPLFIEDRDHNRLIFFAPVEWDDTPLPKPNVYYMKEDEMREYFKYVMN